MSKRLTPGEKQPARLVEVDVVVNRDDFFAQQGYKLAGLQIDAFSNRNRVGQIGLRRIEFLGRGRSCGIGVVSGRPQHFRSLAEVQIGHETDSALNRAVDMQIELLQIETVGINVKLAELIDAAGTAQNRRGVGLIEVKVVSGINQAMDMNAEIIRQILSHAAQLLFHGGDVLANCL